jgi:putative DNA primase/helicase
MATLVKERVDRIVDAATQGAAAQAAHGAIDAADALHCSDYGNARRLIGKHGHDLHYCHEWNKWLVWDGRRWREDANGEIVRRAKNTVEAMHAEAAHAQTVESKKLLQAHALKSEGEARINAMISLARSEPGVPVAPVELDADPFALTVANGTIDLRSGLLRPADRADLSTRIAPFPFDENAECPTWLAFLHRIMRGRQSLIDFLQRAAGYSLTGDVGERVVFILYGTGANGKSVLVETMQAILGDYALRTPTETLLAKREGAIPNDVAKLKGARLVSASESDEGRRLAESLIKELTGGDTVSARFMRGEFFEFKPECKIWLRTNHMPEVRGTDEGIWDRLRLIPFEVRIPPDERDKQLQQKLLTEAAGILNWMIQGCALWQRYGLGVPLEVSSATQAFRNQMDQLSFFIEDCCVLSATAETTAADLFRAYTRWCEDNNNHAGTQQKFGRKLQERGLTQMRTAKARMWRGVGLLRT